MLHRSSLSRRKRVNYNKNSRVLPEVVPPGWPQAWGCARFGLMTPQERLTLLVARLGFLAFLTWTGTLLCAIRASSDACGRGPHQTWSGSEQEGWARGRTPM